MLTRLSPCRASISSMSSTTRRGLWRHHSLSALMNWLPGLICGQGSGGSSFFGHPDCAAAWRMESSSISSAQPTSSPATLARSQENDRAAMSP